MEPIFKNETMKIEKARFERIDKDFRYILSSINTGDQRVVSLCRVLNLRSLVDTLVQQLSICQKSLNEYLEVYQRLYCILIKIYKYILVILLINNYFYFSG